MLNKRLMREIKGSMKFVVFNVILQLISLCANIAMMTSIAFMIGELFAENKSSDAFAITGTVTIITIAVRFICSFLSQRMSYMSSKTVKKTLRERIYTKLLRMGTGYKENVKTSEVIQVAVEGVDQLDTFFGAYLPQFFYAMTAPIALFIYLCFINVPSAVVLVIFVPLIPISIAVVQTWAKKLLSKYWGKYTSLGNSFLENLQGLTTLKIYGSDEYKNDEMNKEAEGFRKITMKVLTMQLNSITIMDLVAYGGAAAGIIMGITQFGAGSVSLAGCILIILLSADFFIPMRLLGSFFHIAMNGMAASKKIFKLLDMPDKNVSRETFSMSDVIYNNVTFAYDDDREILHNISLNMTKNTLIGIVGESGSGKSTIAKLLMGENTGYKGSIHINGRELGEYSEESLMKHITYVGHQDHIFKGTVRENLLMAKPQASDEEMWDVLGKVRLSDFLRSEHGLDTEVLEDAANISGGQRQRLSIARALLHDSDMYIFDEATSNIDVESENAIMSELRAMTKDKTVILISHRLANVEHADNIYVLKNGEIVETGSHKELLTDKSEYEKLWSTQQELENYGRSVSVGGAV